MLLCCIASYKHSVVIFYPRRSDKGLMPDPDPLGHRSGRADSKGVHEMKQGDVDRVIEGRDGNQKGGYCTIPATTLDSKVLSRLFDFSMASWSV